MSIYAIEIQRVVRQAIEGLELAQSQKKIANSPVTNAHFFSRWITKQIKAQSFHISVVKDLKAWQKMARSKGSESNLESTFRAISALYQKNCPVQEPVTILDKQIEDFLDTMENEKWWVSTEFEVKGSIQLYSEGNYSLVLCAKQCDDCFDGEVLIKPMSFYIRGNASKAIEKAEEHGLLLHKMKGRTNIKYHTEYLVYPMNKGNELAEIPFHYYSLK